MAISKDIDFQDFCQFIESAFVATKQREFYEDQDEQEVELDFFHDYMVFSDRESYARALALDINHANKSLIVKRLLASGKDTPDAFRKEENALIEITLLSLPPQRVYKLFSELQKDRVNNRRTRALAKRFLEQRDDLNFDAVKYRNKLKSLIKHNHISPTGEVGQFLFTNESKFDNELLANYTAAPYSNQALFQLPFTVAEGLAARKGISRKELLKNAKLTLSEKRRLANAMSNQKLDTSENLQSATLLQLCKYILGLTLSERKLHEEKLRPLLESKAKRAKLPQLDKSAVILDNSYSSRGSFEKSNHPLALCMALYYALKASSPDAQFYWTKPIEDPFFLSASGATDLATPLLKALQQEPRTILIVSDGYENAPRDACSAILDVYFSKIDPQRSTMLTQLNPVFEADQLAPRALSPQVPLVGIQDIHQLPALLTFAQFKQLTTKWAHLENYLISNSQRLIEAFTASQQS